VLFSGFETNKKVLFSCFVTKIIKNNKKNYPSKEP